MNSARAKIAMCAALTAIAAGAAQDYRLYNVVPMYSGHEVEQAAKCVEMYERTGEDLALYSLTLHPEGKPAREKVDRYVASFRAFVKALEGTKVRPAVLVQAILGHWPRTDKDIEPWERTIDQDGRTVRFCPLDPGFGAYIDYVFTEIAKSGPAFILTDDDVRAYSHGAECFCDTHVKLFNSRRGTSYTRDQLRAAVRGSKPGEPDYDTFLAMQREMMENAVVGRIRKAIDAVDPSIPAGICIAGEEHYMASALARRIAAKGQTPVMRCSTGLYGETMCANYFPGNYMRMRGFAEYCRGSGIEILDEADTCPQNLWSKSARSFYTHLAASAFSGFSGAKTWYVNGLRRIGPVAPEYTEVLADRRGRLDALARAVKGTRSVGLAAPCFVTHPGWHLVSNHHQFFVESPICSLSTTRFGIPVTASREFGDKSVVFALSSASEVARMTDAELEKLFSGKVFVFRDAAVALTKRSLSRLTGVKAVEKKLLFSTEWDNVRGVSMAYTPAMDGSVEFTAEAGAERLSNLVWQPYSGSTEREVVAPATVYWRNALGGECVTTMYHYRMYKLHECSVARKTWFTDCIDKLSGGDRLMTCGNLQDVLVSERVASDGSHLVFAVNLNSEPIKRFRLRAPEGFRFETLSCNGNWRHVLSCRDGEYAVLDLPVAFYEDVVIKATPAK